MVTFVCYHCDRTLKKKQVDPHIRICVKPAKLACIGKTISSDCKKWFDEKTQKAHISCISEQEMWHGQFFVTSIQEEKERKRRRKSGTNGCSFKNTTDRPQG